MSTRMKKPELFFSQIFKSDKNLLSFYLLIQHLHVHKEAKGIGVKRNHVIDDLIEKEDMKEAEPAWL